MSVFSFETRRAAELAKMRQYIHAASCLLETTHNSEEQVKIIWELAYTHLCNIEDYRLSTTQGDA